MTPRLVLLLTMVARAETGDASRPHPHRGVLKKYDRVSPGKLGLTVPAEEEALVKKRALLSKTDLPGGFRRTSAVRDIRAPADVVFDRICDLENYPEMIDGVVGTEVYQSDWGLGTRTVCARSTCSHLF